MALQRGIYRISQWGTHQNPQILTNVDGNITVSPVGAHPTRDQEWFVDPTENGNVAIQNPPDIFPSRSLSFEGEAREGARVVPGPLSDFPTREWRVEPAPERPLPIPYLIRVPNNTELIVAVSAITIYPPQLALTESVSGLRNAWVFELVRPQ